MIGQTKVTLPSPTPESIGSGARPVTSVAIALLEQHLRIDLAEGTVPAYRRLVSHLSVELAFVVAIPKPAPGRPHWEEWEKDHKEMIDLERKFLNRDNPYGSAPSFRPLDGDPENVKYRVKIGDWGPESTVMGADLAAGVRAMLEPYRDYKFEQATMPLSAIHLKGHEFLEKYGLMKFDSKYSNAAPTSDDKTWQEAKDASDGILQEVTQASEAERAPPVRASPSPEDYDGDDEDGSDDLRDR